VSKGNINANPDTLVRAIQHLLKDKAAREALTEAQFRGMDFKVHHNYDITSMSVILRIVWHDPDDRKLARCIDHKMSDEAARDLGLMAAHVEGIMTNLSLRGELFFFKLAKHFPRHLKEVKCDNAGTLTVVFKNGHTIDTPEVLVESKDFLAKCGMIYDL
jgi:hypothetical protein